MSPIKTFMEINMGGVTKEHLIHQLLENKIQFNEYAKQLFAFPTFDPIIKLEKVTLAKVTWLELGLSSPNSIDNIIEHASNLGLRTCPLALAAFLRLKYLDQSTGPYLTIVSTPPVLNENFPTGFYLRNVDGSLWLRGYRVSGNAEWPTENEFIFLK